MSRIRKGFKVLHAQLLLRRGDQNLHHLIPVAPPAHHHFIELSKTAVFKCPFSLAPVWRVTPSKEWPGISKPPARRAIFFSRLTTGELPGGIGGFEIPLPFLLGKTWDNQVENWKFPFSAQKSYPPWNDHISPDCRQFWVDDFPNSKGGICEFSGGYCWCYEKKFSSKNFSIQQAGRSNRSRNVDVKHL